MILKGIDATVLAHGSVPVRELLIETGTSITVHEIGDRVAARTVEKATLEELAVGWVI